MANFGAADVPSLLADFGAPITVGADTVLGLVDRDDVPQLGTDGMSAFTSREVVVTIQTGTLPGLTVGGAITVDGSALKVSAVHALDDGELTKIVCVKL